MAKKEKLFLKSSKVIYTIILMVML